MNKYLMLFGFCALVTVMILGCTSQERSQTPEKQVQGRVMEPEGKEAQPAAQVEEREQTGEQLFEKHCAKCHRGGGNIMNSEKTLYRAVLESNNIRTPEDIISTMRNPGKGMPVFDESRIPDTEAKKIGEYILRTFQ